jgi:hypothetical protein
MSKTLQRKKPGYTKNGEVKIVSLNYQQLTQLASKASKKKIQSKIQSRMRLLEKRKNFVSPAQVEEVVS